MMIETQGLLIQLKRKAELQYARDNGDDWTGKSDAKERRKAQNRLHQRAWRRKKAIEKAREVGVNMVTMAREEDVVNTAFERAIAAFTNTAEDAEGGTTSLRLPTRPGSDVAATVTLVPNYRPALISFVPKSNPLIPPVISYLPASTPSSGPAFAFPISPDHYLLTLVQYNVLRAVITNLQLCNLLSSLPGECRAALTIPMPDPPSTIPPAFASTQTQRAIPHPSWIDTVPCAQLRDNLIVNQGRWDEDELCEDICGGLYEGYDDCMQRGLLVWDEPWKVGSWEASKGFVEKWGWLLQGCEEMMRATNFWREERGEERLVFEVVDR